MMKKALHFVMVALCAAMVLGCGSQPENKEPYAYIQAIVFQREPDGKFGLINLNAEVLVEPQFDKITKASCDRFFAKNDNGLWRLYTLEAVPKRVGEEEYLKVGFFVEGLCPVIQPDAWPKYIDIDGNTVFEVKEYNGKSIDDVYNFQDGMARVQNEDGLYGFVDKTGKMVIEPQYESINENFRYGKAVVNKPLENSSEDLDDMEWAVIDHEGNELFATNRKKMRPVSQFESNDLMIASTGGGKRFMTINSKGEKGALLDIDGVDVFHGDWIQFWEGSYKGSQGIMNLKGEVIIEPKYENIVWYGGPILAKNDDRSYYVLNQKGEVVNTLHEYHVSLFEDDHIGYRDRMLCYTDSTSFSKCYLADAQGNKLPSSISFYHDFFDFSDLDHYRVCTDYGVIDRFVSELNLSTDGMMGIKIGTSAKVFDEQDYALIRKYKNPEGNVYHNIDYSYVSNLSYIVNIAFTNNYYNDEYGLEINEKSNVSGFELYVMKNGTGDALYNALLKEVKGFGELLLEGVELEGYTGDIYKTSTQHAILIGKTDNGAFLFFE